MRVSAQGSQRVRAGGARTQAAGSRSGAGDPAGLPVDRGPQGALTPSPTQMALLPQRSGPFSSHGTDRPGASLFLHPGAASLHGLRAGRSLEDAVGAS